MQIFITAKLFYMFRASIAPPPPRTVRSVPEAATTVLCTPDDGRDGRPEHVE